MSWETWYRPWKAAAKDGKRKRPKKKRGGDDDDDDTLDDSFINDDDDSEEDISGDEESEAEWAPSDDSDWDDLYGGRFCLCLINAVWSQKIFLIRL